MLEGNDQCRRSRILTHSSSFIVPLLRGDMTVFQPAYPFVFLWHTLVSLISFSGLFCDWVPSHILVLHQVITFARIKRFLPIFHTHSYTSFSSFLVSGKRMKVQSNHRLIMHLSDLKLQRNIDVRLIFFYSSDYLISVVFTP